MKKRVTKKTMLLLQDSFKWNGFSKPLDKFPTKEDGDAYYDPIKADKERFLSDNNLCNPYSTACCIILYIYSMELGKPPLYKMLNHAMRTQDNTYVSQLGPYAQALFYVTERAERFRIGSDKLPTGEQLGSDGPLGNFSGSFVLFRGGIMKREWIKQYADQINQAHKKGKYRKQPAFSRLPGNTSCSHDLGVALKFSFPEKWQLQEDLIPTLFVIAVQNESRFFGVRLNNECYSSYPGERELLLKEGCGVWVVASDDRVVINNKH